MPLTPHAARRTPHGASRLVQAMSAWSVETRRGLSRHYRGARVYGHMTTAMHDIGYTPYPPPYIIYLVYMDWVASVGNDTVQHAAHYVH